MELSQVPNPPFPSVQDITLYRLSDFKMPLMGPIMMPQLRGSSMEGRRSIVDFFKLLDYAIEVAAGNDYKLQKLDDTLSPLTDPPVERSSSGNITAGSYLIVPSVQGGKLWFNDLFSFSALRATTDSSAKRVKRNGGSTGSQRTIRDPSDNSQGFKMRLVYRDKGCAICLATGIQATYKYCEDSNRYEGAHIIDFAYQDLWDAKGFSSLITDPFTDPTNAGNQFASPSTRTKKDLRRINSLENGILLCVEHHKDFDNFRFSIHPQTHKIYAFHPATARLQDVEVKAPWNSPNALYPSPLPTFLEMHYAASIAKAMKGGADDDELDDDDEDFEGPSELAEVEDEQMQDEQVRIWLGGPSPSTSFDFTADNKGNIEMLAGMRGVVGV